MANYQITADKFLPSLSSLPTVHRFGSFTSAIPLCSIVNREQCGAQNPLSVPPPVNPFDNQRGEA